MRTSPASARSAPVIMRTAVVLPAPLGPSRTVTVPEDAENVSPSSAGAPPNVRRTARSSTTGGSAIFRAIGIRGPCLTGTVGPCRSSPTGIPVDLADGATVAALLDRIGLTGRVVVVERNGEPVDRGAVGSTVLRDGDRCEVVRAVAGG